MSNIRVLNAEQTAGVLCMDEVIEAVKNVYSQKAAGRTIMWPTVFHEFERGVADMDIKSGAMPDNGIYGLKMVSWFGENLGKDLPLLNGTILLNDAETGVPFGLLNGGYVTGMRTGAAGAVGAKYLAREDSENLLIVGAGHIATFQIAATLLTMKHIRKVRIYDKFSYENAKNKAASISDTLRDSFGISADGVVFEAVDDIKTAVGLSDIIITVTPSHEPIIKAEWVKPGTHFSCIGADMEGKQEIESEISRNARIFVDDLTQNVNAGEIEMPIKEGVICADDVLGEIGDVINEKITGRSREDDITIFDATGTALLDLATGQIALRAAEEKNIGSVVDL